MLIMVSVKDKWAKRNPEMGIWVLGFWLWKSSSFYLKVVLRKTASAQL